MEVRQRRAKETRVKTRLKANWKLKHSKYASTKLKRRRGNEDNKVLQTIYCEVGTNQYTMDDMDDICINNDLNIINTGIHILTTHVFTKE